MDDYSIITYLYTFIVFLCIPIISTKRNKSDEEKKIVRKKLSFMHTKRFNTFFKRWVQYYILFYFSLTFFTHKIIICIVYIN